MAALLLPLTNSKPLNPHADSWFPDAKKPSFPYHNDEIYSPTAAAAAAAVIPVPIPAAALYQEPEPFPFPPPCHQFHSHVPVPFESAVPIGYSFYYTFTPETKQILTLPRKPKFLRNKNVPPRLRRKYFIDEDFKENKITTLRPTIKKIWKPKNEEIISTKSEGELRSPVRNQITTVMLKNVPNQYRRDSLMEFLDQKCNELDIAYDFLYLPMDFIKGDNLGFAFVNFTTASAAMKIKEALQDYKWGEFCIPNGKFTSKKILDITWAKIQGKEALVKHFENSRFTCDKIDYLPVVIFPPRDGISSAVSSSSLTNVGHLLGFRRSFKNASSDRVF